MRDDANDSQNRPNDPARQSDEAQTQGRDALDTQRHGVTQGVDVTESAPSDEIETIGRTVVDHSRQAEAHGVDVIDQGPVSDAPDKGADH